MPNQRSAFSNVHTGSTGTNANRWIIAAAGLFLILLGALFYLDSIHAPLMIEHTVVAVVLIVLVGVYTAFSLRYAQVLEQARARLEQQQDQLQMANTSLEKILDPVYWIAEDSRILKVNPAACTHLGYTTDELCSMTIPELDPLMSPGAWPAHWKELTECGSVRIETQHRRKDGRVVEVEVVANLIGYGGSQYNCATVRDISERKEADRKLRQSAREWQETFNAVEDAIWMVDSNRDIVRANRSTYQLFGHEPDTLIGRKCCDIVNDQHAQHEYCLFDQMVEQRGRCSVQFQRNGRWYDLSIDPVLGEAGEIMYGVHGMKDITSLKLAEIREHIRSEILEQIARGESLYNLLGFIARSIEKEKPGALCSILLVSDDGKRLVNGAAPSLPDAYNIAVHRTKIGEGIGSCGTAAFRRERVVVEDIMTHPFWKGFTPAEDAGLRSCWSEPILSASGSVLGTFAIYHREPSTPGPDEIRLIEQASAFAGIAIERYRAEMERSTLEEQLHQSQKMEAIGHLAGGMAHDFNNLLTPIIVYADMLKRAIPPDDQKSHHKIESIISASHKARDLTQQLLSFGRKQIMEMRPVDLNEVVSAFFPIMRRTLRENIDIRIRPASTPQTIIGDRPKIEQAILNLVINAKDAIESTGSISIETGQVMIDDEYSRIHPDLPSGPYSLISVTDDGCGMSEHTKKHIFEPFFTTKPLGEGTGLGLANVYGIVKQHNGHIEVTSTVGKGTMFRLYFPATENRADDTELVKSLPAAIYSGRETILLAEDNDMVREMIMELMDGLGYTLLVAAHPEEALEIARNHSGAIDLLISDVVMPAMDGRQLFRKLLEEGCGIGRVLYMSGYNDNIISNVPLENGEYYLPKPFTPDSFMSKIREILS